MPQQRATFRQHLLGEDIARLTQAIDLAQAAASAEALLLAAGKLNWTPGDLRTHELKPALDPLLGALWTAIHRPGAAADTALASAWADFDRMRIDRLAGCLARVPRPAG